MSQLVDVGIGFIWDPFPVAVNINSCKGGGFDAVFADIPYLIENRIGTGKAACVIIKIVGEGFLKNIVWSYIIPDSFQSRNIGMALQHQKNREDVQQQDLYFLYPEADSENILFFRVKQEE